MKKQKLVQVRALCAGAGSCNNIVTDVTESRAPSFTTNSQGDYSHTTTTETIHDRQNHQFEHAGETKYESWTGQQYLNLDMTITLDIMSEICLFLDIKSLLAMRLVSKQWCQLVDSKEIWRRGNGREIKLGHPDDIALSPITTWKPPRLKLRFQWHISKERFLPQLTDYFANIKSLNISRNVFAILCYLEDDVDFNLTELTINDYYNEEDCKAIEHSKSKVFKKVKHLFIDRGYPFEFGLIPWHLFNISKLVSLGYMFRGDNYLRASVSELENMFGGNFANINSIELYHTQRPFTSSISNSRIWNFLTNHSHITALALNNVFLLDEMAINKICENLKTLHFLTKLEIHIIWNWRQYDLNISIFLLPSLKHLNLSVLSCQSDEREAMHDMGRKMLSFMEFGDIKNSELESLRIFSSIAVPEFSISKISIVFPKLHKLCIRVTHLKKMVFQKLCLMSHLKCLSLIGFHQKNSEKLKKQIRFCRKNQLHFHSSFSNECWYNKQVKYYQYNDL